MKVIKNKLIPFGKFNAINLFGVMFVKGNVDDRIINHEKIHSAQMIELFVVPFYIVYILEWLVRLVMTRSAIRAYHEISFEREAYANDFDLKYLENRKRYSFMKYFRS